eukprot:TRINITY_DN12776_c0_g1_i1.p1 TRINITY_DN12776_c0_g1~~TRINITY_DN12776_c0_g1_i1.p1  ORF type:complete len:315 (+),score=64.25 TRINITY_DN12776_c0_g1_i1:34-978(+)
MATLFSDDNDAQLFSPSQKKKPNTPQKEQITVEKLIEKDSPRFIGLLKEINESVTEIRDRVQHLIQKVKSGETPTEKGLSYLEVKYHLLLQYCTHLSYYALLKLNGRQFEGHEVIDNLVSIRTLIEKMRPLDQKLSYQINKLLKMATLGDVNVAVDAKLKYRPQIDDLAEDENGDEENGDDKDKKYVAPKISAMRYEDEREKRQRQRALEKNGSKIKNSAMASYIRETFGQEPETESTTGVAATTASKKQFLNALQEREKFEEDHMMRLQLTKAERKNLKQQRKVMGTLPNELHELEKWSDMTRSRRAPCSERV